MCPSQQYLSKNASALYAIVPVYIDPQTEQEHAVSYKEGDSLLSGCTCNERGNLCQAHDGCVCEHNVEYHPTAVCDYHRCTPCKTDPRGCKVLAGCECRRAAGLEHLPVCTAVCHGGGRRCANMHKITPREDCVIIQQEPEVGYGCRAKKDIKAGLSIGTYSGVYKTGLEIFELAKEVQIADKRALSLHGYLDLASAEHAPGSSGSTLLPERVLAAYVDKDNNKQLLVKWNGHRVPTWRQDNGTITHALTCEVLAPIAPDDAPDSLLTMGPEAYRMMGGFLSPLQCCALCVANEKKHEGLDYRLYVDASLRGNFTRFINHSCDSNISVLHAHIGANRLNPPVPLLLVKNKISKNKPLSISYWRTDKLNDTQRAQLNANRSDVRYPYNDCRCGSRRCTGWIFLPPRDDLRNAGVPREVIKELWGSAEP